MKIVFFLLIAIFISSSYALTLGSNRFYAEVLLTNGEYGSGAVFKTNVWFDATSKQMRLDYYNFNGASFMTVYYNYTSGDKYQICSGNCSRATWTGDIPLFSGTEANFVQASSCVTPDWPGPRSCVTTCKTFNTNPVQQTGINSLSFNDTGNSQLCLVRWTAATGYTYGPEWHVQKYETSAFTSLDPGAPTTYSSVLNGVTCPKPVCNSVLDIAVVLDQSGSITQSGYWPDVQNFATTLVNALTIGPDSIRAGVLFFSGQSCSNNFTGSSSSSCSCGSSTGCSSTKCQECGGLWQLGTPGLVTDPTLITKAIKANNGYGGSTCIACGLEQGAIMLNRSPKANVQKIIILLTDGAQNAVTNGLARQAAATVANGIRNIAVGVGGYNINDLKAFAAAKDIYTVSQFSQLNTLIEDLTKSVCQALPPIETCDFCNGICSCQTTCNCPTCNDYNMCTTDRCDPKPVSQGGTQGSCLASPIQCTDNNKCTKDLCQPASGCDYSQLEPLPADFNYCLGWKCDAQTGNQTFDRSSTQCPQGTDKCIVTYCNYTQGTTSGLKGSCVSINKMSISSGSSISFKDSSNLTQTVLGCANPGGQPSCVVYSCTSSTGNCKIDYSACECTTNSQCDDNDGCTTDTCNLTTYKCDHQKVDCWSELSSGTCVAGTTFSLTTTTGDNYYNNGGQVNGAPSPSSRTCDALACYGGQRSNYQCQSTSSSTHTCTRSIQNCQSSACQDTSCRSLGTWTNGQANTDCGKVISRSCSDNNLCTDDICNSQWNGQTCDKNANCYSKTTGQSRCINNSNATNCNDNNVCTDDSCSSSIGCVNTNKTLPSNTCYNYACDPKTGNYRTVSSACPQGSDLCIIQYCDPAANSGTGGCVTIDKTTLAFGSSITFTDATGTQRVAAGCQRATNGCVTYGCDTITGQCTTNTSTCPCTFGNDAACNDHNGCTVDKCLANNTCSYTSVDCWDVMSNGGCNIGKSATTSNATSYTLYNYQITSGNYTTPTFPSGPSYPTIGCEEMACFGGQRSEYYCQSTGDYTSQCARSTSDCTKGGCQDNICRSLTTWTNGQLKTDCIVGYNTVCSPDNCTISNCNTSFVYGDNTSGRCITQSNASLCVDGNVCTVDGQCIPDKGCDFDQIVPSPQPNTTCFTWFCDSTNGWYSQANICPTPSNPCQTSYCNTTSNSCVTLSKDNYERGTSVSYVDQFGSTKSLEGCLRPTSETFTCRQYTCNSTTGQCQVDSSQCVCFGDQFCYDGNPCTVDTCVFGGTQCNSQAVDCYSRLSNGKCTLNTGFTLDTATGINQYYGNSTVDLNSLDANGLPSPNNANRTCGQLACYAGQRSFYSCEGTAENVYSCKRQTLDCSRNGCKDEICRALGNWTDNQANTDCGSSYIPICADEDACTNDFCNSNWKPNQPVDQRCIHQPVDGPTFCDDGNFCTRDYCDSQDTTGDVCKHSLYSESYLRKNQCSNATKCQNVECTVNRCIYTGKTCQASTLCFYYLCNGTTNGNCGKFATGVYVLDRCGVCGGNGLSCQVIQPVPNKNSIAVALGVGLGVGLVFAFIILGLIFKKSYSMYQALGTEIQGTVTNAQTYKGGDNHIDTSHYNND